MPSPDPNALWTEFLESWPPERVRSMELSEYTNLDRDDSFTYWIEKRLETLGSIWGGSSFKFGVYRRADQTQREDGGGRSWSVDYAWQSKYGDNPEEAFRTIRKRLTEVIEAARQGDLERIEGTDVGWPVVKWKVAFLYQDRTAPLIFPVFREEWLFNHYRLQASSMKRRSASRSVMYPTLLDRYQDKGDVFAVAEYIWKAEEASAATRYWAVPLHVAMDSPEARTSLCSLAEVNPEDLPAPMLDMLADSEAGMGDQVALLDGPVVRAVGTLEAAEPGVYSWSQRAVEIDAALDVVPDRVVELDASERESIWGTLAGEAKPGEMQYWKLAPGRDAFLWEEWQAGGYIAIGWDELGDISKLDRTSFEKRLKELQSSHDYGAEGLRQVWRFRQIPKGARILANQGTHKLLGIGTVTGEYTYHSDVDEYRHRIPVRWDDVEERNIDRPGWRKTLIQLDEAEFRTLTEGPEGATEPDEVTEPSHMPAPTSMILFGPPGTGKTWATMTRALERLFPAKDVAQWSEDTRARQFRELQRQGRIEFVTFHQAYGYEEFVEGIRPVLDEDASGEVRYELHAGVFKRIALRAAAEGLRDTPSAGDDTPPAVRVQQALDRPMGGTVDFEFTDRTPGYVLIIDEINRGNISKILGELITLLEADKRLGARNELKLPLAYSPQHRFAVPPNLHLIGTMNTADRSIALMDVALRRRFRFEEVLPQSAVIRSVLDDGGAEPALIDLVCAVFQTMNDRIRRIYDRDHQIGHAYFLDVRSLTDLRDVFADRVIPLLLEYFYGSWERLCAVLGCPYDDDGRPLRDGACLDPATGAYRAPMIVASADPDSVIIGGNGLGMDAAVDLSISEPFHARPSGESPPEDSILESFLALLDLDAAQRDQWRDALSVPST